MLDYLAKVLFNESSARLFTVDFDASSPTRNRLTISFKVKRLFDLERSIMAAENSDEGLAYYKLC